MASSLLGSIGTFDSRIEDFEAYIERIKHYFTANDIKKEKHASVLLSLIGPKGFTLASNILAPKALSSVTFDEIVDALNGHYRPKKIIIYERFKFHSRVQNNHESVSDYIAALKKLARTCEFDDKLSENLRDRLVIGLSNKTTQERLLTEKDLTFDKAVNFALSREAALRETGKSTAAHEAETGSVHSIGRSRVFSKNASGSKNTGGSSRPRTNDPQHRGSKPDSKCSGCGAFHWRKDCPFLKTKCHKCLRIGHLKRVCKSKNSSSTNRIAHESPIAAIERGHSLVNEDTDSDHDFVYNLPNKVEPIYYQLFLGNTRVSMQLDTGSYYSLISESTFKEIWKTTSERPDLAPFTTKLLAYGGSSIPVLGSIRVEAKLSKIDEPVMVDLVVVKHNGPSLLGRGLMKQLRITTIKISEEINAVTTMDNFTKKFPELFSPGLGCYKGELFSIEVDPTVPTKYCKARSVPYAMREKVSKEIDRLLEERIIEPVSHSKWAAPVVPVLKQDGSLRLCGDYKITCNKAAKLDCYPIPKIQDLLSGLANKKVFSKLDMSQAYAQLELDKESKALTTINTHRGLFQYNRLAFGISSAPGIFQRAMENLFKDLPNVICYLDDILLVSSDHNEHELLLNKVFKRLQDTGLKLRADKCDLGVSEIVYLGFKITKDGLLPTSTKVSAIKNAPRPTNVSQLRSYLGLINFYRRFLPKAATLLEPLNKLLKAESIWNWGKAQEDAFNTSKRLLAESQALVHFDPTKPIVVAADSSSYGIGGVLYHKIDGVERPVCFISRTLSETERRYPQVEKEALAMVYAIKEFHYYLWGQTFDMITDHRPLLGIFSPTKPIPPLASGRIQRWALVLQAYSFNLIHRSGKLLCTADALSRLPYNKSCENTPIPADWTLLVNFLEWTPITSVNIRDETRKDILLSKVFKYTEMGWPSDLEGNPDFSPYARRRDELSIQDGCLLWGKRVIIPSKLRDGVLKELHANHSGASKMKELARSYLWWPNLDKDLENVSGSCEACLENRPMPNRAELHPWEWPGLPWHRIHVDYAGPVEGKYFLIIVDAHSKWVEIYKTKGTSSEDTIRCLQHTFSTFGLPVSIVSDNGPCFTSGEFKNFVQNCGIRHITTAVYKPSTNGLAERMVQTFKQALKKSNQPTQQFLDRFLFNYRLTPHSTTGVSPAELMFGRKLRSRLDLLWPSVSTRVSNKQAVQVENYSKRPREVSLATKSPVMVKNYSQYGAKWIPGEICRQTGPLSYQCRLNDGRIVKRHQDQLHERSESPIPPFLRREPVSPVVHPSTTAPPSKEEKDEDKASTSAASSKASPKTVVKSSDIRWSPNPKALQDSYRQELRRSNRKKNEVDRLGISHQ